MDIRCISAAVILFSLTSPTISRAVVEPYGINDLGQVVGNDGFQGFVLNQGVETTFSVSGATATFARGINNAGQIAGFSFSGGLASGFIYMGGSFTTILFPGQLKRVS
jgi:uncharacterized membrane protein